MTVPEPGPMSLSGFEDRGWFAFGLIPVALLALYVWAVIARRRRLHRFANADMLDGVALRRSPRGRHVAMALWIVALVLLTIAMAGPTHANRIPRNRAVIMLAIDVSQSMRATDVAPTRLDAAKKAAKQFAQQLTPGINLGLIAFAGSPIVLVSPTPQHDAVVGALDNLRPDNATAIGDAVFAALESVATVAAVLSNGGAPPPPARIVLLSDGKENKPTNPNNPHGAYTAARAAKQQGVPVSTISFGTKAGYVAMDNQPVPVPVDPDTLTEVASLSGGQFYPAADIDELNRSYRAVREQVGFQTVAGPASAGWLRLAVALALVAAVAALAVDRRVPT